jgi:PAS domain S-box-containing protein
MNNFDERTENLKEYVKGLGERADGQELYLRHKDFIEKITPQEAFEVFKGILDEGAEPHDILIYLDKAINAFYKSLSGYKLERPINDNYVHDMLKENKALVGKTDEIKILLKEPDFKVKKEKILEKLLELESFNAHYIKKENILFPYMEKAGQKFEGLAVMWALHDEVREQLKTAIQTVNDDSSNEQQINIAVAKLFFGILGVKKKEELILIPAACEVLSEKDWYEMHKQSLEYDFPFINKVKETLVESSSHEMSAGGVFRTETGEMNFEEILMVFNALPVDLTFVDENNKVRYFSNTKDRIFPRSPAVIGRSVNNCHPPQSVHIVEEIIQSFREGKEESAKFWINIKGKLILIQYFALRDAEGTYKGVLEVSQDITDIKNIDGERRLLTWEK